MKEILDLQKRKRKKKTKVYKKKKKKPFYLEKYLTFLTEFFISEDGTVLSWMEAAVFIKGWEDYSS